jgi:hypothetical protein
MVYYTYMTTCYTACCRMSPNREAYTSTILRGEHAGETFESHRPVCSACHEAYPKMVQIKTRSTRGGGKSECGGACLNGKTSCDCKCNGRCHGAGDCQCGIVA